VDNIIYEDSSLLARIYYEPSSNFTETRTNRRGWEFS